MLLAVPLLAGLAQTPAHANIDWRSKGAVTPVKDQGTSGCGFSWAFATVAAVESAYAIQHGKLDDLAEQQLIDCSGCQSTGSGVAQCPSSGCPQLGCAFAYIDAAGLTSEADYPYTARNGTCKSFTPVVPPGFAANWQRIAPGDETALAGALAFGPVLVRIEIGSQGSTLPAYANYSGGIFYASTFDDTVVQWLVIVGYTANYYIAKNSLGTTWGDGGYINLSRNRDDNLGVANYAYSLQGGAATAGACTSPNGTCVELTPSDCQTAGGTETGIGSYCPTACPGAFEIASVPAVSRVGLAGLAALLAAVGVAVLLRRASGSRAH